VYVCSDLFAYAYVRMCLCVNIHVLEGRTEGIVPRYVYVYACMYTCDISIHIDEMHAYIHMMYMYTHQ
jgi:hypothetical protein